ncbi:MAG: sugar-binding domain-containing protein [Verrucomicrobiota bacterium]
MKRIFLSLQLPLILCTLALTACSSKTDPSEDLAFEPNEPPRLNRMPLEPEWRHDVTALAERITAPVQNWEQARQAEAITYRETNTRAFEENRTTPRGRDVWWRVDIPMPEEAEPGQVTVLEIDESRVIEELWVNGETVTGRLDRTMSGQRWESGEATLTLPDLPAGELWEIVVRVRDLTHLYHNAFGRLAIRPATLNERLQLSRPVPADNNKVEPAKAAVAQGQTATLRNETALPQSGTVHITQTDFFGVILNEQSLPFELKPYATTAVTWPGAEPNAPLWRTSLVIQQDGERSFEYWDYNNPMRYHVVRDDWVALPATGWRRVPGKTVPGSEMNYPVPAGGKKVTLPHNPPKSEAPTHRMWYVRQMEVPEDWQGKEIHLFLHTVQTQSDIFIDGKKIATRPNWELPGTVDLSDHVKPGDRVELAIGVTNFVVALRPEAEWPADADFSASPRTLTAAVDHFRLGGATPGLICVPELWALPQIRTDLAVIRTEVKDVPELSAQLEILNSTKEETTVTATTEILHKGNLFATLPVAQVKIAAGEATEVEMASPLPGAKLWWPEDPQLYEMRITLSDSEGNMLDVRRERFGVRQWGIEGRHFTLNGARFKVYGSSHLQPRNQAWPFIPDAQRIYRHHFKSPYAYNGGIDGNWLADEMGIVIKDENATHDAHGSPRYAYDLPVTWDRVFAEFENVYRLRPNNASTWMWDIGNELYFATEEWEKHMGALYGRIKAMDPTRFVTNSGGLGTPRGPAVEMYGNHDNTPPHTRWPYWFTHPEKRPDYLRDEVLVNQIPQGERSREWSIHDERYGPGLRHVDGKPMFFSESLNCNSFVAHGLLGQQAYLPLPAKSGSWAQRFSTSQFEWAGKRKYMVQFVRQSDVAAASAHVNRAFGRSIAPIAAFPLERSLRYHQDNPIQLSFSIHNDRTRREKLEITWQLLNGKELVAEAQKTLVLDPARIVETDVLLVGAGEISPGLYDLVWTVRTVNGDAWWSDSARLSVLESSSLPASGFVVFDPGASLKGLLPRQVSHIKTLTEWDPSQPLLIGSDALADQSIEAVAHLREGLRQGARVVILDQQDIPNFLTLQPDLKDGLWNSAAPMDNGSFLTRGLIPEDLRFWRTAQQDQIVNRGMFEIPRRGDFRAHTITGDSTLKPQTSVLEIQEGQGRVLFSQLNLAGALGHDPIASEVLSRLMDWLFMDDASDSGKTIILAAADAPEFSQQLVSTYAVNAEVITAGAELPDFDLLIVNGSDMGTLNALEKQQEALQSRLETGARLFLLGLDPALAGCWAALLGKDIGAENYPHGQVAITSFDPLVAGLNHADLTWDRGPRPDGFQYVAPPSSPARDLHTGHVRLTGVDLQPLTQPAYIGKVPLGQGEVIISNVRSMDYPIAGATRVLTMLLHNAGGGFIDLADNDTQANHYRATPVDLRPFVNRQFADEFDAKVRGFQATGPKSDLRTFPTGEQTFHGVTFDIIDPAQNEDKSLIAMSGTRERGVLPDKVEGIPVGIKADKLAFLYTSGWGASGFQFKVWNEDRARWIPTEPDPFEIVEIKPQEDIRDWTDAHSVEDGTVFMPGAQLAWISKREHGVNGGVYMKIWENPHPEKVIESIDILSDGTSGKGQPFILAISALSTEASAAVALNQVLPPEVTPDKIIDHWQNHRYGVALLKDGSAHIHDAQGNPRFYFEGWNVQGQERFPDGSVKFHNLGRQKDQPAASFEKRTNAMGLPVRTFTGTGEFFDWKLEFLLQPTGPVVRTSYQMTKPYPEEFIPRTASALYALGEGLDTKLLQKINADPAQVHTAHGTAEVRLNLDWRRWVRGYWVRGNRITLNAFETSPASGDQSHTQFSISIL